MRVLGIDPGTSCGWAVVEGGRVTASGTWDLAPRRHEGGGMRYLRAKNYIEQVIASTGPIAIGYEEVRRHRGVSAAHVYGGIVATLQQVCEARGLPYRAIPVGTVKKIATGKGNADKDAMIAAAKRLGYYPETDDEADAIFIALALEKELTT